LTRRLHEYELEIRRLENEREELTAAYKEAEAVSDFILSKNLFLIAYIFRVAKLKRSVPKLCPLNTESSVMKLNAALPSRKKKSKLFGEYRNKNLLKYCQHVFFCFVRFT
jgi:hypothetical protein